MAEPIAVARVDPLPVRLGVGEGQFLLYVGDRKVASAWGPVVDDPDTWVLWNGYSEPYRIGGGRDGALALVEDRRDEWVRHEGSLWHPDHGEANEHGWVAKGPAGAICVGCGEDLADRTNVSTVVYLVRQEDPDSTRHYICDHCETYLDDDAEADRG